MNYRLFKMIALSLLTASAVSNAAAPVVDGKAVEAIQKQELNQQSELLGDLMRQVMQLQQEVSYLRGKTEEQGYQLRQLISQQKELYADLDRRLTQATQGGMVSAGFEGTSEASDENDSQRASTNDQNLSQAQRAYNQAFSQFSEKKYALAKSSFNTFVKDYPKDPLAANAHYILGQLYSNDKEYKKAAFEFEAVYSQFPETKIKDKAMLKLAQTQELSGDIKAAKKTYQTLAKTFPNTTAGKLAKVKLSSF